MELSREEEAFIANWEVNRTRKRSIVWKLAVGLPAGVAIVLAIFAATFSGWYTRADMELRVNSGFLVLIIAAVGIVIFMTVFSAKHKWDINEQHYRELLAKRDRS